MTKQWAGLMRWNDTQTIYTHTVHISKWSWWYRGFDHIAKMSNMQTKWNLSLWRVDIVHCWIFHVAGSFNAWICDRKKSFNLPYKHSTAFRWVDFINTHDKLWNHRKFKCIMCPEQKQENPIYSPSGVHQYGVYTL